MIAACRVNSPAYEPICKPATRSSRSTASRSRGRPSSSKSSIATTPATRSGWSSCAASSASRSEVELIDKLEPYEFPFLGILPLRPVAGKPEGLVVRYVYPDGPAAKAGVLAGDQIVSLAKAAKSRTRLLRAERLRTLLPDAKVAIGLRADSHR